MPDACGKLRPKGICGLVEAKKSISFPTENGMLIETVEDMSSRPMAIDRGFFSGLANATILRKDDELDPSLDALSELGKILDSTPGLEGA
jgi:hypothetical protein